jgi:hypothetical protein
MHDESQQRSNYDLAYYESFILHVLYGKGAAIAACQVGPMAAPQNLYIASLSTAFSLQVAQHVPCHASACHVKTIIWNVKWTQQQLHQRNHATQKLSMP